MNIQIHTKYAWCYKVIQSVVFDKEKLSFKWFNIKITAKLVPIYFVPINFDYLTFISGLSNISTLKPNPCQSLVCCPAGKNIVQVRLA